jgi:laminin beta 1
MNVKVRKFYVSGCVKLINYINYMLNSGIVLIYETKASSSLHYILECNCNNHADSCHYDEGVYQENVDKAVHESGGVCDDCQHNTEGRQCESCKPGYYQDPNLPLHHVDICEECDCESSGTIDGGLCDHNTDMQEGTIAGRCHCKRFTDGSRCDYCKKGYWNFLPSSRDGCQGATKN